MKKHLITLLLVGIVVSMSAQNLANQGRNTELDQMVEKMKKETQATEMAVNDYTQQVDSIYNESMWSKYAITYTFDWYGRVMTKINWGDYTGSGILLQTEKTEYQYRENGAIEQTIGYQHDGTNWNMTWKEVYTFNEQNLPVMFVRSDMNNGELVEGSKMEMTYDENGYLLEIVNLMNNTWEGLGWQYTGKNVYINDEHGYVIEDKAVQFDNYQTHDWIESFKRNFTRLENGDYSEVVNSVNQNGEWTVESKETKEFDEVGRVIVIHNFTNMPDVGMTEVNKSEVVYAGEGNEVAELIASDGWNGPLALVSKQEFVYDENMNYIDKLYYNRENDEWVAMVNHSVSEYDNNVLAENVLGLEKIWNEIGSSTYSIYNVIDAKCNNKWLGLHETSDGYESTTTIFYSEYHGISENFENNLNVVGLNGKIVFESETPENVFVYDMSGRCVATRSMTMNCEIALQAGVYVVKAGNGTAKVVVK